MIGKNGVYSVWELSLMMTGTKEPVGCDPFYSRYNIRSCVTMEINDSVYIDNKRDITSKRWLRVLTGTSDRDVLIKNRKGIQSDPEVIEFSNSEWLKFVLLEKDQTPGVGFGNNVPLLEWLSLPSFQWTLRPSPWSEGIQGQSMDMVPLPEDVE